MNNRGKSNLIKLIIYIAFITISISNMRADFWSTSIGTNSSSWSLYRQTEILNFDESSSINGNVSPVKYHGRNLGSYSSYYKNIKENDVESRQRMSALEGSYKSEQRLTFKSNITNSTVYITVSKPPGSDIFTFTYNEWWPVLLISENKVEYSGKQINDRDFEGNNQDFIKNDLLYNKKLKKEQETGMLLTNMNATVLSTNSSVISVNFEPNKYLDQKLDLSTTGIADLRYRQSGSDFDFKRQNYFAVDEGGETYYGTFNITRDIHMKLLAPINYTTESEWLPCCGDGHSTIRNGVMIGGGLNYPSLTAENETEFQLWYRRGLDLLKSRNYSGALEAYEKAVEYTPSNASAWNLKGTALAIIGRYNESMESFNKALEVNPHYAPAWYNIGRTFANLGKYREALEAYNKSIDLDQRNPVFLNGRAAALASLNSTVNLEKPY